MSYTGTILAWHSRKGYGFIQCKDFDEDLFVHVSGFGGGELIEGKKVSFDVEDKRDGKKRCVNVEGDGVDPVRGSGDDGGRDRYSDRRGGGGGGGGGGGRRYDSRDRDYDRRDRGGDRDRDDRRSYDRRSDRRDSRDRGDRRSRY
ncbi:hypothetical protein DIPPA_31936 [Diplonema papillatum]|nr:hypothetical protein DIPPA_31936 [Diplonema papillatum]KAJ9451337.1 hypothetical protein DIPPA_31936 [Diplonema papillatum]